MKYRKKPIVIDAFRYNVDPRPDWFQNEVSDLKIVTYEMFCIIQTLEGKMKADAGDFIIRGIAGEIYPCKPNIFNQTYELAEPLFVAYGDHGCET